MIRVWHWSAEGLREEPATALEDGAGSRDESRRDTRRGPGVGGRHDTRRGSGDGGRDGTQHGGGSTRDTVVWIDVRSPERADWEALRRHYDLSPVLWNRLQAGHTSYGIAATSGTAIFGVTLPGGRPCLFLWTGGTVATICTEEPAGWARLRQRLAAGGDGLPRSAGWLLYFLLEEILHSYGDDVQRLERRLEPVEERFLRDADGREQGPADGQSGPASRPVRAGSGRRRRRNTFGTGPDGIPVLSVLHRRAGQLQRRVNSLAEALDRLLEHNYNNHNGDREGDPAREMRPYLRALRDHARRLAGRLDNVRELVVTLMNLHLALAAERTNRLILRLTVLNTIFLPLTFLTGIYGMNFRHMPELDVPWAYPALLAFMLVLGLSLWWFFRREYE
ncbi:MAG TPA: CorA family divalent cation transporter [Thermaerobacter sp.]